MAADDSGLKLFSLGIVLQAKVRGDDYISVMAIEKNPMSKGTLSGDSKTNKAALANQHGVKKTSTIKGGVEMLAKWCGGDDANRQTPPDVQPGETVKIYSFADTNDYYWTCLFREPSLRRLETVRHSFSNLPGGSAAFGDDTSYWIEYSTHDKHVKLHTSSNDGEPTSYDIKIDGKLGEISIQDELGNSILLNSPTGTLTATVTEVIEVNTKKFTLNATESAEINTAKFTLNAPNSEINGDKHTVNAALVLTKGMSVAGTSSGDSSVAITGKMTIDGEIQGNATISTTGEVHGSNI